MHASGSVIYCDDVSFSFVDLYHSILYFTNWCLGNENKTVLLTKLITIPS